jgi:N-acyl homoserine lactone hydrolase
MLCGWLGASLANFLTGEPGRLRVPVPSFLVRHPRGTLVFDAGLHPEAGSDPRGRLGWLAKVFDVHFTPGEDVASRLRARQVDPDRVDWLVNSHLHFDHTGGNALLPNARVLVQRREWEAGHRDEEIASNAFDPKDYDLGHDVLLADGEHDVFGDGSVVCLPTPGHTPGHQSLRVRLSSGDVVLTADACYLRRTLEELHLPPVVHDVERMRDSLGLLRSLRDAGARLVFGHDPEQWNEPDQPPWEAAGARAP